jgi:hypothetical protein
MSVRDRRCARDFPAAFRCGTLVGGGAFWRQPMQRRTTHGNGMAGRSGTARHAQRAMRGGVRGLCAAYRLASNRPIPSGQSSNRGARTLT